MCCPVGMRTFAAEVSALLLGSELVFPVHACRTGLDHALHELEGVERAAETGLRVSDDGRQPVPSRYRPPTTRSDRRAAARC